MKIVLIASVLLFILSETGFILAYTVQENETAIWTMIFWPIVYFHLIGLGLVAIYYLRSNVMNEFLTTTANIKETEMTKKFGMAHQIGTKVILSFIIIVFCLVALSVSILQYKMPKLSQSLEKNESTPNK